MLELQLEEETTQISSLRTDETARAVALGEKSITNVFEDE